MMSFISPCHLHPLSLFTQNTWRLLTVRSACLIQNIQNFRSDTLDKHSMSFESSEIIVLLSFLSSLRSLIWMQN